MLSGIQVIASRRSSDQAVVRFNATAGVQGVRYGGQSGVLAAGAEARCGRVRNDEHAAPNKTGETRKERTTRKKGDEENLFHRRVAGCSTAEGKDRRDAAGSVY